MLPKENEEVAVDDAFSEAAGAPPKESEVDGADSALSEATGAPPNENDGAALAVGFVSVGADVLPKLKPPAAEGAAAGVLVAPKEKLVEDGAEVLEASADPKDTAGLATELLLLAPEPVLPPNENEGVVPVAAGAVLPTEEVPNPVPKEKGAAAADALELPPALPLAPNKFGLESVAADELGAAPKLNPPVPLPPAAKEFGAELPTNKAQTE